mmetsp:Transcript_25617/g.19375  ORF Transcript_25617/g.19375 Transcript_25617/m.19375 type:complete len:222 (-) Transcript_25617:37-702(-)|eukprot:CAMPEP_0202965318 /NCGR_PEP_ID=MMETSP1396-20130829/9331_1 /ASSEMBLY_ACC=CAM_ASM_000872 /TAXON_ID= /ORGANISM="Pseudokeronopsis sp., Strain Brazil" /LENGTH=221 /DNA_ID=CAMNT_0049687991 /DNA_START=1004 /DNA_END=1669 /DNA_ORIENTATION=-
MRKRTYAAYMKLFESAGQRESINKSGAEVMYGEFDNNELCITIKTYNTPTGLATTFHLQDPSLEFNIFGPLSKGLAMKDTGTHMFFAAGTGVLTFLDAAGYLARVNAGIIPPEQVRIKPGFRMVVYVSFKNEADSVALEYLRGVEHLTKTLGFDNFTLEVRLSDINKQRWDFGYVEKQILLQKNLTKVYVCGPPLMNESFDKIFNKMHEKHFMPLHLFDVM